VGVGKWFSRKLRFLHVTYTGKLSMSVRLKVVITSRATIKRLNMEILKHIADKSGRILKMFKRKAIKKITESKY
jgi:hypothetical protein